MSNVELTREEIELCEAEVNDNIESCTQSFKQDLITKLLLDCNSKFLSDLGKKAKEASIAILVKESEDHLRTAFEMLKYRVPVVGTLAMTGTSVKKFYEGDRNVKLASSRWQKLTAKFFSIVKTIENDDNIPTDEKRDLVDNISFDDCDIKEKAE